ncbi:MAG: cytochrome c oxidase assembly protein [Chloroflexota bacterium]|nr:cytochrome c oxidase assembly protein [Chloroflexota bacterium]
MLPLLHAATGPYQYHWNIHADVVLLCIFVEAGYLYAVTQLRDLVSDAGRVRRRQLALFSAGVLVIYAVAGTPVHDLSEQYLLSFHMFQHSVFVLIAAPLLLAGIPVWMWQAMLRVRGTLPVARVLTHPLVAFSLFNGLLLLTHLPFMVNASLNHHALHFFVHAALLVSAMIMWWPVLSEVPELPHIAAPLQMAYLFLQSLLPSVMASFITFADGTVYSFYERAPRTWGLSPEADQQIGGGLMKLMGSVILWSFIAFVFFKWYAREERASQEPKWDDVREELEAMGLTRKG